MTLRGNSAGRAFTPPVNAESLINIRFVVPISIYAHPLNNYDINYRKPIPTIEKAVNPAIVSPGSAVTYTITVNTNRMSGDVFQNIVIRDVLCDLLSLEPDSLAIEGVDDFSYQYDGRNLSIYNMQLSHMADGISTRIVITFAAVVNASDDYVIPNTALLSIECGYNATSLLLDEDSATVTVFVENGGGAPSPSPTPTPQSRTTSV